MTISIETTDIILQADQLSKLATTIVIIKIPSCIVLENITLVFGVKLIVLVLGAVGIVTL